MSNWRRGSAKVEGILGLVVLLAALAGQAVLAPGMPATWRLRRVVRSKAFRQAREEAAEQLRERLGEIARTYGLRLVLCQTIDSCSRGSRLNFRLPHSTPGVESALTGHLRIIGYFAPSEPVEQAVPELIERLPPQPQYSRDLDPHSPGPHSVHDGREVVQIDWDIPGEHLIPDWQLPRKSRKHLRRTVTNDPAGLTPEQAREAHGPLVAWYLTDLYYDQPKSR
ncbi:hypothetical protein ACIRD3_33730 [Kitasatospora sp. NPDC093550]|uniref:hypothetical protein n=1 Tax=Kitasatospora sp. NPDC093550 TaxID=3364089 RepID=UPI0038127E01